MKTTILRWNKILAFCVTFIITSICSVMHAGDSYFYARVTPNPQPTGAGTIHITSTDGTFKNNEDGTYQIGGKNNDTWQNKEAIFNISATPGIGYRFNNWECNNATFQNNDVTTINSLITVKTANPSNTENNKSYYSDYTLTANFQRIKIDIGTATWTPSTILTWKNRTVNGKITVPVTNAIATNDFTNNGFGLTSPHFSTPTIEWSGTAGGSGTVTISTTYTLQADGYYKPDFNLVAAPGREDPTPGETTTLNQVIEIPVDLTPAFTIPNTTLPTTAEGKSSTVTIHPADYGELPLERVTWTASISGTDATCFTPPTNPTNGSCTITYQPTAIGTHTATLTLHASYTDAHGEEWTDEQTCTLSGECIEDRDPELYIQKGGVTQSTALYEFPTTGSTTATFDVASLGVAYITAVSANESLVKPTLSVDSKTLTLAINSLSTQGTQNVVITVSGQATIGENVGSTVSATLTVTIHRWFKDITVTATPDATSMVLKWTSAGPEVTSYQILRGSTILATVDKNTLTYTDKGPLTADKSYTYTIKALSSGANYSVNASFKTAVASSFLRLDNCPEMLTITNVDASAAFQSDGTALMDRLYIMNKKNVARCHIYYKYDDKSYKLQKTVDPRAAAGRVGRIENKKIYIAGTCESLYWNTGDYLGWMQPVNCDIYLDNARLRTASSTSVISSYLKLESTYDEVTNLGLKQQIDLNRSASVFYLLNDSTNIHVRGNNYLGGNLGRKYNITLIVTYLGVPLQAGHNLPKYCAPIEIKDSMTFIKEGTKTENIPAITCSFDATWADHSTSDGYIDLSTRPTTYTDGKRDEDNPYGYGVRCESPLTTGGPHGTFIINGGRINLWPANAIIRDIYKQTEKLGTTITAKLGALSNFMVCGRSEWELRIHSNDFNVTGPLATMVNNVISDIKDKASLRVYGSGNGTPRGKLIINGGTITANTDVNSFGYVEWTGDNTKDATNTTEKFRTPNVVDLDGNITQPLFGPNIEINGGTFLLPLYGTEKNNIAKADGTTLNTTWQQCIPDYNPNDYKAINKYEQPVSRNTIDMSPDAGNTDYTEYSKDITEVPSRNTGYIVNAGSENEYQYGMMNVRSDNNSKCYFYLPCLDGSCIDKYKSYWVENNQELKQFDAGSKPYNLTVDNGGTVSIANDYRVYGRPYYRSGFQEGMYHLISMPFEVEQLSVLDPEATPAYTEVAFTAFVEDKDKAGDANNNMAYCYLYHLDDSEEAAADDNNRILNQRTTGTHDVFRNNYHTHKYGNILKKGKTYTIKFLESGGYWENNPTIFKGKKNQIVNGKNSFDKFAKRPTNNLEFVMDGNASFASQEIDGEDEIYLLDPDKFGNDSFYATKCKDIQTLKPMQGYLLGNKETMDKYRRIGREGKVEQTALDQLIHTGWTAVGAHQAMLIMTPQDATAHIYTAEGKLWKTISLTANTGVVVNAPAGFYIVHTGNESKKVLVH